PTCAPTLGSGRCSEPLRCNVVASSSWPRRSSAAGSTPSIPSPWTSVSASTGGPASWRSTSLPTPSSSTDPVSPLELTGLHVLETGHVRRVLVAGQLECPGIAGDTGPDDVTGQ